MFRTTSIVVVFFFFFGRGGWGGRDEKGILFLLPQSPTREDPHGTSMCIVIMMIATIFTNEKER